MLFIWTLSATATNFVGEVFARAGCGYCPSAQLGLEQIYDGHPNVIPILWYGGSSPAYSSRGSFYGLDGVPDARFNGNINVVGGAGSTMYSYYLPKYNEIIARNSPLEMSNTLNIGNNQLIVNTNVVLTGDVTQTNNKLVTVLTRHNTTGGNRFLGLEYHEQPFNLTTEGQTQDYTASFTFNQSWNLQELKAVSFVQSWSGDKIILQGTQTAFSGLLAFFTADITSGVRDLTVNFKDISFPEGGVLEWQWDFDNDGVIDSYEQYPTFTYTEPGTYTVSLTVSDGTDNNTSEITDLITVYDTDNAQGLAQGVWHPDNGTYYIVDDITVPADAYLEILPGTQIVFNENTKMFVNGTIVANGTEENPIRFFSESNWKGIVFEYSENDNEFAYCEFMNADGSALKITNSNVKINSCNFTNNTGAATAGAVDISGTSIVEIKNSFFANNKSSNNAGAIGIASSTVDLKNNIIANNTGQNAGALIVKNSATLNAINNTIANNVSVASSGAQILNIGSTVNIMNTIFYGASDILNLNGFFETTYSNMVNADSNTGNINQDPMFANPSASSGYETATQFSDWLLQASSPCIDAGNPDAQYNDKEDPASPGNALYPSFGTLRNDMGAFGGQGQFNGWVDSNEYIIIKPKNLSISAYPNPFNPSVNIELNRSKNNAENVHVDIYNVRGQKINNLFNQYTNEKTIRLSWNGIDKNGKAMPSGIYFIKAVTESDATTKKIILLK